MSYFNITSWPYQLKNRVHFEIYWKLLITFSIFSFLIDSDSFPGIVPKAPKTIGIITVFTLNCLLASAAKSMYLSVFSSMMHLDLKIHIVPRALLPINHYDIWPIITHFPIIFYCLGRLLLCHHLFLLQHWVHGSTTYFL